MTLINILSFHQIQPNNVFHNVLPLEISIFPINKLLIWITISNSYKTLLPKNMKLKTVFCLMILKNIWLNLIFHSYVILMITLIVTLNISVSYKIHIVLLHYRKMKDHRKSKWLWHMNNINFKNQWKNMSCQRNKKNKNQYLSHMILSGLQNNVKWFVMVGDCIMKVLAINHSWLLKIFNNHF